jgi:hypothetical protein
MSNWQDLLVSASEIVAYRDCPRKWGFGYVEGIRSDAGPAAALGTEVDDEQIQPYLREGRTFDYSRPSGDIAASMLPFLPQPGTVEIQKMILMPSPTWLPLVGGGKQHVGFGYIGFSDIWAKDSALFPGLPGGAPGVGDTKTTSDISKWAKTEKSLSVDVQAMLYATYALFTTGAEYVDLAWIYGQTKGARKGKLIKLRVTAKHVAEQFAAINDTAIEMLGTRRQLLGDPCSKVTDLEPNVDACQSYGGCPYQALCNLGPLQIMEANAAKANRQLKEGEKTVANIDLLANLKARAAAAKAGATPAPAPVAPPVQAPAPAPVAAINPPEAALPPAPAVGIRRTTSTPPAAVVPPPPAAVVPPPPAAVAPVACKAACTDATTFTVVWGEEKIQPLSYNDFTIGPFEATGEVQQGETLLQAMERVYADLTAFAEGARIAKAESFASVLGK